MKGARIVPYAAAFCLGVLLCGCGMPVFTSTNLADRTITYYTLVLGASNPYVPNGHDTTSFLFDSTGRAGTFEEKAYTFDYATQADVTADVYANTTWFQDAGFKGDFTYAPDLSTLTMTVGQVYTYTAGASPMTNGKYAAADYAYEDIATAYGTPDAVFKISANEILTVDSLLQVIPRGAAASTWEGNASCTYGAMAGGFPFQQAATIVQTVSITDSAISVTTTTVSLMTISGTTTKTTTIDQNDYAVINYFLIGQSDTPGESFANVWKYGNKVSFQLNRTYSAHIEYTGDTPPTAPSVDPSTGHVETGVVGSGTCYNIDVRVAPETLSYSHQGSYIIDLAQETGAVRGLGLPKR